MRQGTEAQSFIEDLKARGATPSRPEVIPGWQEMTAAERQQHLLRRFKEDEAGISTAGPVRRTSSPSAPAPGEDDAFDPDAPDAILSGRAERYRMPNGKWVWVHPCSVEESVMINARALTITGERRSLAPGSPAWDSPEIVIERHLRAQVMQVIHCCRRGPEATSAPTFDPLKHVEWLMREPGYVDAIQRIVRISDALGEGASEAAVLKEAMIAHFARARSWAETWRSLLTTDSSGASLRAFCDNLEDFAASASCMTQPESLCPEAWFAWQLILRDAPEPEPAEAA
jgi:hypothetical protein